MQTREKCLFDSVLLLCATILPIESLFLATFWQSVVGGAMVGWQSKPMTIRVQLLGKLTESERMLALNQSVCWLIERSDINS